MSQQPVLLTGIASKRPGSPAKAVLTTTPDVSALELENAALKVVIHTLRDYINQLQTRHGRFDEPA